MRAPNAMVASLLRASRYPSFHLPFLLCLTQGIGHTTGWWAWMNGILWVCSLLLTSRGLARLEARNDVACEALGCLAAISERELNRERKSMQ